MTTRRSFLGTAAVMSVAGCLDSGFNDRGDGEPEEETPTEEASYASSSTYGISVDRVAERKLYEDAGTVRFDEVSPAVQDVIAVSIDEGYETDDVSQKVAEMVREYDYVEREDETYQFDAEFPEYVVEVEPVAYEEIDESATLGGRELREHPALVELISDADHHGEGRTFFLAEEDEDVVRQAEYVTFAPLDDDHPEENDYFAVSLHVDDPGAPYTLDATAVPREDVFADVHVIPFEELSPDAQTEFENALDGRFGTDEHPALLEEENKGYIRYEGSYYQIAIDVA